MCSARRLPITAWSILLPMRWSRATSKGSASRRCFCLCQKKPNDFDDGLLTASEVAQLKLNADWVVLSACNTAAGEKPGAEALSGLARAFFYAGGRSLLVSNWEVETRSAVALMVGTFAALAADPKLSHAEALRRAMLDYMNDGSNPWN